MPKKVVSVSTKISDSFQIDVNTGKFNFKIDQPEPVGLDSAPTPLQYFLSALGGCICTVGKTIAKQQKIDLKGIEVNIDGDFDSDVLLGKSTTGRAGFTKITVNVKIDADLSTEQKEKFIHDVEKRCPVSDNLSHGTEIELIINS